ncbi:ArsR/SmtB family transcription factor [Loktanella sp. DJP18]|uniref:ArsR/SmtB family transcription factor n=1 Tax=Loktanella sp. DJP18 TaxID=3409788 RepID=UPI003BB5EBB5
MSQTPSSDPADRAAALFKRLANPMRLSLMLALRDGPQSVSALQEAVGAPQPVVSVNLSRMRGDGLVTCQRTDADARIMVYALADSRVLHLIDMAAAP